MQKRRTKELKYLIGFTFLDVTKQFLDDRKYKKRVGTTTKGYKGYLNNHILPEFEMKKLRNITTKDLENLYDKMSKKSIHEQEIL